MQDFDVKPFIEAAEILVGLDETERALLILNNLPAYYRDNTPNEVTRLKNLISSKITLPHDLLNDERELPKTDEWSKTYLDTTMRGMVLKKTVEDYNEKDIYPHIIDLGPGDATFAIGMHAYDLNFTYNPVTLNQSSEDRIKERIGNKYTKYIHAKERPTIFVAFEIIEHLYKTDEIRHHYDRNSLWRTPEYVILSTPKYTYSEGTPKWKVDGIHHLRAYTPKEFMIEAMRLFPEYDFTFYDNEVMVLSGKLRNKI